MYSGVTPDCKAILIGNNRLHTHAFGPRKAGPQCHVEKSFLMLFMIKSKANVMPELILIPNCQRHQSIPYVLNRHRDGTGEINADNAGRRLLV